MDLDFLTPHLALPYEREHEGWICERIVEYFESISVTAKIWAVGQHAERHWPADERTITDGKLFGLQFKRPYPTNRQKPTSFDQLHWEIDAQSRQYNDVKQNTEIFYLLPTMLNRNYRRVSLHHCMIWRPTPWHTGSTLSYQKARWPCWHVKADDGTVSAFVNVRWGEFVEQLQECPLGYRIENEAKGSARLNSIIRMWQQERSTTDQEEDSMLFLVNVR